jgi:hypothetical protein
MTQVMKVDLYFIISCSGILGTYITFVHLNLGGVPEWPKGTDCKSVGEAFGGSNPPPSTDVVSKIFQVPKLH